MRHQDIKNGDVLTYVRYNSTNPELRDASSEPVQVVDREVILVRYGGYGRANKEILAAEVVRVDPKTMAPTGEPFKVPARKLNGLWHDTSERIAARQKKLEAQRDVRKAMLEQADATVREIAELTDPALPRVATRNLEDWHDQVHVDIGVLDLLALIKAARKAALDEMEGVGGRHE